MRTILVNPTSVSNTVISIGGRRSAKSDSPLMALAIITMLAPESSTPSTAAPVHV